MKRALQHALRRLIGLARGEDGNATVEFVVIFPIYMMLMAMSFELSLITLRQTLLERGLDIAVRDIRLGTGEYAQNGTEEENAAAAEEYHDKIKARICEQSFGIGNCEDNLKLEMVRTSMRSFAPPGAAVMCTDRSEKGKATYHLEPGQQNDLMFLRACLKYDPLFPAWQLARALKADPNGQLAITSMSAFVMEPL